MTTESGSDILIPGNVARNRAVHGDLVVVELVPRAQWLSKSGTIQEPAQGNLL